MEKTFRPDPLAIRLENWQWRVALARLMDRVDSPLPIPDLGLFEWCVDQCEAGIRHTEDQLDSLTMPF